MFSRSALRTFSRPAAPLSAWTTASLRPAATAVGVRAYHQNVIDHYERPRNVGTMNKNDPDVGTGLVGAPACGDVMRLQIRVDPATGKIADVKFKTYGCGSAIASSSLATTKVLNMDVEGVAGKVRNQDLARELCLPPVKLHCSMLAEDAVKRAVDDWKAKRAQRDARAASASTSASASAAPAAATA
ncbi:hypothetical protein CXG81DRAFT_23692 [Caulochytrium protostelioides]|uniref:NIF system FeS cluster assembly NifU N-terminal domain-containing protein n=1 Tax=Caulochytrium protostelioides TaxID=1555241 RepID=A0A4V1IVD9_9FUNG|nr:hypothetical protein CXG81DRAFT_23692 [Caulochytrium protostelioides]|eukprot:RKP03719.1 hypothetical protein CXG81DRAFT_23692 [Caulochytrium protostelioides]